MSAHSHRIFTANIVQRQQRHIAVYVHHVAGFRESAQTLHQHVALLLEDLFELLEYLEVKRRRDCLAPVAPLLVGAEQQTVAQPTVEERVDVALGQILVAVRQHDFRIARLTHDKRDLVHAHPHAKYSAVVLVQLAHGVHQFCGNRECVTNCVVCVA